MIVAGVVFENARRRSRPDEVALLLGVTRVEALLVVVGATILLGAGLWLANEVNQLGEGWLLSSLALFVVSVVLGALGGSGRSEPADSLESWPSVTTR